MPSLLSRLNQQSTTRAEPLGGLLHLDINDNGLPLQEAVISGDWVSLLESGDHQMPLETEPVDQARRRRRLNPPAMPSRARAPGAGTWAT